MRVSAAHWRLTPAMAAHLEQRYLLPQPRSSLAEAVLQHAAAAMDVSDGLAGDLAKLCRASAVAAEIDVARVPLSDAARAAIAAEPALLETVLTGGDDYEIVLTLAPEKLAAFRAAADAAGVLGHGNRARRRKGRARAFCTKAKRSRLRGRPTAIFRKNRHCETKRKQSRTPRILDRFAASLFATTN